MHKLGDKKILGELIEENNGLIWNIVRRFKDRGYELEDIYQIGSMGFIKSIQKFDFGFDVRLSTYAVPYILGEIKRFLRDDGMVKVSRSIKELAVRIREIENRTKREGKELNIEEIAKELEVSKDDVVLAMDSYNLVTSLDEKVNESEEQGPTLIERISTRKDEETETVNKILLTNALEELDDKDRQLIFLRYFKGQTQSNVAKILGISQVQVSRTEKKILGIMKMKIASA